MATQAEKNDDDTRNNLRAWIGRIEERISALLDFAIEELEPKDREAAAARLFGILGRFIELEQSIADGASADDPASALMALILGEQGALPQRIIDSRGEDG